MKAPLEGTPLRVVADRQQVRVGVLVTREPDPTPNKRERRHRVRLFGRVLERDGLQLGWIDLGGEG